jgi:hypothetical protein
MGELLAWIEAVLISRRRAIAVLAALTASMPIRSTVLALTAADVDGPEHVALALERINQYRAAADVRPAGLHPALMESANGHASYFDQNKDAYMTGLGLHEQLGERPGFTGVTMRDRARGAGYTLGPVTENAGFGGLVIATEWAMGTVNHRLPLIHPSAVDLGLAQSDVSGFNVMAVGLRRGLDHGKLPSFYPANGATGVPVLWDGGETPDPAPGLARPLGFPITVCFALGQQVEWETIELIGPDGAPVEADIRQTAWMSATALIPHRPLARASTYFVRLRARLPDGTIERESSFQTR